MCNNFYHPNCNSHCIIKLPTLQTTTWCYFAMGLKGERLCFSSEKMCILNFLVFLKRQYKRRCKQSLGGENKYTLKQILNGRVMWQQSCCFHLPYKCAWSKTNKPKRCCTKLYGKIIQFMVQKISCFMCQRKERITLLSDKLA